MKVTVTQGIRVVHDGRVYQNGQSADVPERVARRCIHCGWASDGRTAHTLPDPRGLASATDNAQPEPKADRASKSQQLRRHRVAETHD
jgi:hypothetical protein